MDKDKNLLDACDGYIHRDEVNYKGVGREEYTPTIYFLTKQNKIVYIGETVKPLGRFNSHKRDSTFKNEWDIVYFKSLPTFINGDNLRYLEGRSLTYLNRVTFNKSYRLVDDVDVNPLAPAVLNLYLANTKADYFEREYKRAEEELREARRNDPFYAKLWRL